VRVRERVSVTRARRTLVAEVRSSAVMPHIQVLRQLAAPTEPQLCLIVPTVVANEKQTAGQQPGRDIGHRDAHLVERQCGEHEVAQHEVQPRRRRRQLVAHDVAHKRLHLTSPEQSMCLEPLKQVER
jgi:hypothetical protein